MNEDFSAEIQELYERWISAPSAAVCTRLADRLRVSGKSDEAIDVAKQGLEEWPDNVALQVVMGRCLLEGVNVEEAEKIFLKVRKKDPFNLVALKGLSTIAMDQEKYSEAESLLEEYLFENPTDEEAENMLEQAKFKSKATPVKESTEEPPSEEPPPPSEEESTAGSEDGSEQAVAEEEEASADTSEAAAAEEGFPQTHRMKSVLEQQEPSETETREVEEEEEEEEEAPETEREQPLPEPPKTQPPEASTEERRVVSEPRREPRSLLDLFTEEERAELGLEPYGSTEE
ncbi:tetratricopeptide repeat protein [Candidatus Fermentibacteria bacterium]|nr:tetratricopeptide repeat protein [Candidatus Fermentibacteria bacterium]